MKNLNSHIFKALIINILAMITLSACGGGENEEQRITIIKGLPSTDGLRAGQADLRSATQAIEQLKVAGINTVNQRCSIENFPSRGYAIGPPTSVIVEINAQQLPTAVDAGFRQLSENDMQYYKDTFDCASRSL